MSSNQSTPPSAGAPSTSSTPQGLSGVQLFANSDMPGPSSAPQASAFQPVGHAPPLTSQMSHISQLSAQMSQLSSTPADLFDDFPDPDKFGYRPNDDEPEVLQHIRRPQAQPGSSSAGMNISASHSSNLGQGLFNFQPLSLTQPFGSGSQLHTLTPRTPVKTPQKPGTSSKGVTPLKNCGSFAITREPADGESDVEDGATFPEPELYDVKNAVVTENDLEKLRIGEDRWNEKMRNRDPVDANAPPNKICESLMSYRVLKEVELQQINATRTMHNKLSYKLKKENAEREFDQKACESLVKKLKDKKADLQNLIDVVESKGTKYQGCITITRTLDGRLQVHSKKGFPHVVYGKLWRFSEMSKNETRHVDHCKFAFEVKNDLVCNHVCVNPYHYEIVVGALVTAHREHDRPHERHERHERDHSSSKRDMSGSSRSHRPSHLQIQTNMSGHQQYLQNHIRNIMPAKGIAPGTNMGLSAGQLGSAPLLMQHPQSNPFHLAQATQQLSNPLLSGQAGHHLHYPQHHPPPEMAIGIADRDSMGSGPSDPSGLLQASSSSLFKSPSTSRQVPVTIKPTPSSSSQQQNPLLPISMMRQLGDFRSLALNFFDQTKEFDPSLLSSVDTTKMTLSLAALQGQSTFNCIETIFHPVLGVAETRKQLLSGETIIGTLPPDAPYSGLENVTKLTSDTLVMSDYEPEKAEGINPEHSGRALPRSTVRLSDYDMIEEDEEIEEPPKDLYWGTVVYYEMDHCIGEKQAKKTDFWVDGGFLITEHRYCLGLEPNPERTPQAVKLRQVIIDGVRFSYKTNGDIWLHNCMQWPVFVTSGYLDMQCGGEPDKVHKIYGYAKLKVFGLETCKDMIRDQLFSAQMSSLHLRGQETPMSDIYAHIPKERLQQWSEQIEKHKYKIRAQEAAKSADDLRNYCCIRLSFCKGFGAAYPTKPDIKDCPVWIEVKVNSAYDFMDRIITELNHRCGPLSLDDFEKLGIDTSDD